MPILALHCLQVNECTDKMRGPHTLLVPVMEQGSLCLPTAVYLFAHLPCSLHLSSASVPVRAISMMLTVLSVSKKICTRSGVSHI